MSTPTVTESDLPQRYDPKTAEPKWQAHWEEKRVYSFVDDGREVFSIDTPPPYVSADHLHIGHAMSYTHADIVARYQRMCGKNVFYPMGFDDNGLPTERFVEKKYNINKAKTTRADFIKLCLDETRKGGETYRKLWTTLGISVDWSLLYSTIDPRCREISQRSFLDLYSKGRMELVESPTTWCMTCQTTLAQADFDNVDMQSTFNDIVFLCGHERLIISTTRPELIPACVALAAHPDDPRYAQLKGKMAQVPLCGYEVPIIFDESVQLDKGTGLMMVCTFGDKEDIEKWHKHSLALRIIFTEYGKLNDVAGAYAGLKIKEARVKIIDDLKSASLLVGQKPITHAVNVHERCGTEVEFLKKRQWQIRVLDSKEELLAAAQNIKWHPEFMKVRYEHWVQNLQWNWGISRQRFYGVPFPVWYCTSCAKVKLPKDSELPVDPREEKPSSACTCGSTDFRGEEDVMDTWMTSSVTPDINAHWGMRDERKNFLPMSLRPQAHDIIRTWAFYTITKAYFHHNAMPWSTIMISGHGQDPNGQKMSKSKGNVVEPSVVVGKYSADALRMWAAGAKLGDDLPYQEKEVMTSQKTITKLWNAGRFTLMNLSDYNDDWTGRFDELETADRWILSKCNNCIKRCTEYFESYEYAKAKAEVEQFFWTDFCDNYMEIVKGRLYEPKDVLQKRSAQFALSHVLNSIMKLLAPFAPFITEELYQLRYAQSEGKDSIHVSSWPVYREEWHDVDAETLGTEVLKIIDAVRKHKSVNKLAMNAPLASLTITTELDLALVENDIVAVTKAQKLTHKKGEFNVEIE